MTKLSLAVILLLSALATCVCHAQTAITFNDAKAQGIGPEHLDSLYASGIHADTTLAVFKPHQEEAYIAAYQQLLQDFGKFLKENGYIFDKNVKGFNRVYFAKTGKIDYFLYSIRPGQITSEQEARFAELLTLFIQTYTFPMTADRSFSQCSSVTYTPPVE